jgi:DNA-binding MarR family transcriptional regulator
VRPRIGELAERLQIQHHSAVELVNRLGTGGFVRRRRGGQDRREVLVSLSSKGEQTLRELALHHHEELRSSAPALLRALKRVVRRAKAPLVVQAQKEAVSRAAVKRKMSTSKSRAA